MKIAFAVDDDNGLMFNRRRVSMDKMLRKDLMEYGDKLAMQKYSASQFEDEYKSKIRIIDSLENLEDDEIYFMEGWDGINDQIISRIDEIILYRWNRKYPSDVKFDTAVLDGFKIHEEKEFKGSSHEKITREIYRKI